MAAVTTLPENGRRHIPHAFGFVYRQIMNDKPVPSCR